MGLGSFFKRGKKEESIEECHIEINGDDCDACEKCIVACPNNVLMLADDLCTVRNAMTCKRCRVCVTICPNDCITVN